MIYLSGCYTADVVSKINEDLANFASYLSQKNMCLNREKCKTQIINSKSKNFSTIECIATDGENI